MSYLNGKLSAGICLFYSLFVCAMVPEKWCDFLLQDAAGSVKLWEVTRGIVIEDYGKVALVILIRIIDFAKIDWIGNNTNQCLMGSMVIDEGKNLMGIWRIWNSTLKQSDI